MISRTALTNDYHQHSYYNHYLHIIPLYLKGLWINVDIHVNMMSQYLKKTIL